MATQAREPDPETAEKVTRRRFTPAYKLKILARTDHASVGQIAAILREEGLYSSLLSTWRRQRDEGTLGALKPKKRGPKPKKDPEQKELERLRRRVAQLVPLRGPRRLRLLRSCSPPATRSSTRNCTAHRS